MEVDPEPPFLRGGLGCGDSAEILSPSKWRKQLKNEALAGEVRVLQTEVVTLLTERDHLLLRQAAD